MLQNFKVARACPYFCGLLDRTFNYEPKLHSFDWWKFEYWNCKDMKELHSGIIYSSIRNDLGKQWVDDRVEFINEQLTDTSQVGAYPAALLDSVLFSRSFNTLNAELNPICHLPAL
jgi:hypothetical protein